MSRTTDGPEPTIASVYCYPVKGLSPQRLDEALLSPDAYFPNDRIFAIENGPSGYDPNNPAHFPKSRFLMLMRDEKLALLRSVYDSETNHLTIRLDGEQVCDADLTSPEGRATVEAWFGTFCRDDLTGAPKLLTSNDDFRFTDSPRGYVSLVSLASLRAIQERLGRSVDPLRFRANLYLEGFDPWRENTLVGHRMMIGDTILELIDETDRCAATSVNPQAAERDMNLVKTLVKEFGHNVCGVYARVIQGGTVRTGDPISLLT